MSTHEPAAESAAEPATPAAITRLLIPRRRAGTVPRRRLIEFLHHHLERRLLLVVAPAGYGKTTLVVEFAHEVRQQGVPICWLTLEEADQDVRSLFANLLLSVQQRYPAFGRRTAALLRGVDNASRERRAIATAFCNDVADEVDDFLLLVCEDFHTVADEEAVCDVVDVLLQRLPDGAHVLLSSRQLPTKLNLARLAARLDVAGLGTADLRFQLAEAQELIRRRTGVDVPLKHLRQAVERAEGWVTGLLLALQGPDALSFAPTPRGNRRPEPTYEFLATQVFDALPATLQRFLMESAVLPALSADECGAVLERADAAAQLDEALRLGLFVELLEEPAGGAAGRADGATAGGTDATEVAAGGAPAGQPDAPWLRYHQLWREFLLARLAVEDPARLAALRRRLSNRALAAGSPDVAVDYLLAAHDWPAAARLLGSLAEVDLASGRAERLLGWIARLPAESLAAHPILGYHAARALRRLDRIEDSVHAAERAERLALDRGEPHVALLARVWQAEMLGFLGQGERAAGIVEEVFKALGRQPAPAALVVRLEKEACITLAAAGRNAAAAQHGTAALKRLRSIVDDVERTHVGATIHHAVGVCLARLGDATAAARHYRQAAALWQRLQNATQQARVLNMQAALYKVQGDANAARAAYETALDLAEEVGHVSTQVAVLNNLARLHREQGAFDAAREAVERSLPLARQLEERSLLAEALQEAGALALQEPPHGQVGAPGETAAIHLLESALDAAGERWPAGEVLTRAWLALAYARTGQRAPATRLLDDLAAAAPRAQGALADVRLRAEVAGLAAQAALGQPAAAATALRFLRRWARDRDRTPALYQECARYPETARLLLAQRGLPADATSALAAVVVAHGALSAGASPAATGAPGPQRKPALRLVPPPDPADFRLQLFSAPSLARSGVPVRVWRTQLAREVLFYLALHAGHTIRTEALIEALLPESAFDRGLTALRYAIYQVRRLFTPLAPLHTETNGYRLTLEPGVWCDAIEFQRLLADAAQLERGGRRAAAGEAPTADAREAAVALYAGPLLDGLDAHWVLPLRAQMERQFLAAAHALLDYYAGQQWHDQAVYLAQRVLRLDPFQEDFHLAMLRHHLAAGHLAAARQHFEYYRRLMRDELGQEPAVEAQRLAAALALPARFVGT